MKACRFLLNTLRFSNQCAAPRVSCLPSTSRSCEVASCWGLSFRGSMPQSLFSSVWTAGLNSLHVAVLINPKHAVQDYGISVALRTEEGKHTKRRFSRNSACTRRALLHGKEGDGLRALYPFACWAFIPLYRCSPVPLCSPTKQLMCWAPRKESIYWCICSCPEDTKKQRGSSVRVAERKQFISLSDANVNMFLLQSWVRVGTLRWLIYMKFLACVKL